jgi:MFS family permease
MPVTATPPHASAAEAPAARLLSHTHAPVVAGMLALVTLGAFENRAVVSILPSVVRHLDGWALFGASAGAPLVTITVATAYAGGWTDRVGPRRVLLAGLVAFVAAQVVSGLAPNMGVFVVGRGLSGIGEALLDTSLYVLIAQALPEQLRAKVFASFAAAWVLPSLLGPSAAGALDAVAGWRAVFIGPLLVVPVALALVRPAFRHSHVPDKPVADPAATQRLRAGLLLAGGLAAMTFSGPLVEADSTRTLGLALTVAGFGVLLAAGSRILPPGTVRFRPGLPAVIGLRFLTAVGFMGIGGLIPLMLVQTRGVGPALAGASLGVTGTLWAAGSWLNSTERLQALCAGRRLGLASTAMAVGAIGPVLIATGHVSLVAGLAGWALSALGMGIASPTYSTQILALAPATEQGRASAAQSLAISMGAAVPTGLGGTVVALQGAHTGGATFAILMLVGAAVALGAAVLSRRVDC